MKKATYLVVMASILPLFGQTALAYQGGKATMGYVGDSFGHVVTDSAGQCVHDSSWSKDMATAACDAGLMPKKVVAAEPAPQAAPAPVPEAAPEAVTTTEKITLGADTFFGINKSDLRPQGDSKLDALVDKIKAEDVSIKTIDVTGFTSSTGTAAYNQKLSERRAASVKSYLVSKGVNGDKIVTRGMGERQPVASNKTKEGRAKNRRVEIDIKALRTVTSN